MLHIILLILKIIGAVLLGAAGLAVLAVVCVLFVPVRYRVRISRQEGEGRPPAEVYVKATWLLHLVNVLARYPADVILRARVLFFTLFRKPQKEKKRKEKRRTAKPDQTPPAPTAEEDAGISPAASVEIDMSAPADEEADTPADDGTPEPEEPYEPYSAFDGGPMTFGEISEEQGEGASEGGIGALLSRIGQTVGKIKGFFQNIRYTIRRICDKIKSVSDNIQYYRDVMESEAFRGSLHLCGDELLRICRMLKPARFEADFVVGMKDPAATGEILAVYGMLYPLIGQHVNISGDFTCEDTRIEGRLYVRGRIRLFTLLRAAVRGYFNRDIRKLISLLKKEAA